MAEMKPAIPGIEDYNEARLDAAETRAQVAALTAERDNLKADALTVRHLRNVRECIAAGKASGADLSDAEVAGRVRMLTRYQLDHEFICVMARDRIIALSDSVTTLEAELAAAQWRSELYLAANAIKATVEILDCAPARGEIGRLIAAVNAIDAAMLAARAPEGTEGKDKDGPTPQAKTEERP